MKMASGEVLLLVALACAAGFPNHVNAGTGASKTPVVLELFTSEGCSSCPPADRLLESLDEQQPFSGVELIVLSEHVDYWNEEGWADPYSSKVFSARQQWYAEGLGLDGVYTPQAVIDGQRETVGSNTRGIENAVDASLHNQKITLTLGNVLHEGPILSLHLESALVPGDAGPFTAYVAIAENKVQSNVGGGENGGRLLTHVAVVRTLLAVGTVRGGSLFSKDIKVAIPSKLTSKDLRIVAFLQDDRTRRIAGATCGTIETR